MRDRLTFNKLINGQIETPNRVDCRQVITCRKASHTTEHTVHVFGGSLIINV